LKILIIRFSSIGDIVLTSPIMRCIKEQMKDVEIHYLTKKSFQNVLVNSPNIDTLHVIDRHLSEIVPKLKNEKFDLIIDLHHNLRTLNLKRKLKVKSYSFDKLNLEKFLVTKFKINRLPKLHIVDRYFKTIESIHITNDQKGLDYFINVKDEIDIKKTLPINFSDGYYALVVGGSYFTKQISLNKLDEICSYSKLPLVLLGGKEDEDKAELLYKKHPSKTFNLCGKISLNQSASLIKQSVIVITSDTGLMHIAAAYRKKIISIWGNTIPEFGMGPYLPNENSEILEVKNLSCRPCSKLGYNHCPKGHFKCMNDISIKGSNF
jgi:ADP-heptose:LPS heptosyltransferase